MTVPKTNSRTRLKSLSMSPRARATIAALNKLYPCTTIGQLRHISVDIIRAIPNAGTKTVCELEAIKKYGRHAAEMLPGWYVQAKAGHGRRL